jgi:hypothetical protein
MRQILDTAKLGQPSNCEMSFKRTLMKRSKGPGVALCDEGFVRKNSDANDLAPASRTAASFSRRKPAVKIFVAYDSDLSRDRARQMEAELGRRLGCSFSFSISAWKLKSLWHPKMLRMATEEAAKAEIILFSLVSGGDLPQAVKNWLEKGLVNAPGQKVCLLALLEIGGALMPQLSPAEVYLSNLSWKIGADCLCYSDSIPLVRFGHHLLQPAKSNPGNGFTPRRLKTPFARSGTKRRDSSDKAIGISV